MAHQTLITRFLTPAGQAAPSYLLRQRVALREGLPATVALDATLRLVVAVPNGHVRPWQELDPATLVADSSALGDPVDAAAAARAYPLAARLYVLQETRLLGVMPLTVGCLQAACSGGGPEQPATLEVSLLGWQLHAGSMCSAGDFGSWIELAWRRIDRGTAGFQAPVARAALRDQVTLTERTANGVVTRPIDVTQLSSVGSNELAIPIGGIYWRALSGRDT